MVGTTRVVPPLPQGTLAAGVDMALAKAVPAARLGPVARPGRLDRLVATRQQRRVEVPLVRKTG